MTRRTTRSALLARTALASTFALMLAGVAAPAFAQSTNAGTVVSTNTNGGGVAYSGATSNTGGADTSTITLGGSRTILNWSGFNLASGDTLNFVFGSRGDIVLNRVQAGSATIDGFLNGRIGSDAGAYGGNVWFTSSDGVVFGANARVNVGGLLAATGAITDTDFLDGDLNFGFSGAPAASAVSVLGGAQLNVYGGTLALVAPSVGTAAGSSVTDQSGDKDADVLFGAADQFTISFLADAEGDLDLFSWSVPGGQGSNAVTPLSIAGTTTAGNVYLAAVSRHVAGATVNITGSVTANGAVASGDGKIVLVGGGGITGGAASALSGSTVTAGASNLQANGDVTVSAGGDLTLDVISGGRDVALSSGGFIGRYGSSAGFQVGRHYSVTAADVGGGVWSPNFIGTGVHNFTVVDTAGGAYFGWGGKTVTGDLSVTTLNGGGLTINGDLVSTGGNVILAGAGGLTLQNNLTAAAGKGVYLSSSGDAINQTGGAITADLLQANAANYVWLARAGNNVGTLLASQADWGAFTLADVGGLTVAGPVGAGFGGGLTLTTSGALTVNASNLTALGGNMSLSGGSVTLNGTQINSGGALAVGGPVTFNGGAGVVSVGSQSYDAVTLGGNTTLTTTGLWSGVTFGGAVDGGYGLTVSTNDGSTTFNGAVGATTALSSLDVTGAAGINGGLVRTTGAQTYGGAVSLGADTTLASTGAGAISLNAVDGARRLWVNTAGTTSFNGPIGGTVALTSLNTDAGGATVLQGSIRTVEWQTFGDAVVLAGSAVLTSTGGGAISFNGALNGGHDLTVNTAGQTSFNQVGFADPLASLTTDAAGSTRLTGGLVRTTGRQTYNDAFVMPSSATLTSTGAGAAGDITFGGTVDGAGSLTVNSAGTTLFAGAVGASGSLVNITTDAAGTTRINSSVRAGGAQTYRDAVVLGGNVTLSTMDTGEIVFAGAVDGGYGLTVDGLATFEGPVGAGEALAFLTLNDFAGLGGSVRTTGAQTYADIWLNGDATLTSTGGGDILFGGRVDGPRALTVDTGGSTIFASAVGGTSALTSLTTDGAGSTAMNGGSIRTTGTQTYGDAVSLGGNTVLTSTGAGAAGDIRLGAVTGNGYDLSVQTVSGATTVAFGGAVSGLNLLDVDAGTVDVNAAISGGTVELTARVGGIAVDASVSAGTRVALDAQNGAITGSGLVAGPVVTLLGDAGVGTGPDGRIHTAATTLYAGSGSGGVFVNEANAVVLGAGSALSAYDVIAGGDITVEGGVSAAAGDVALQSTGGGVALTVGDLYAGGGGDIRLTAAGAISGAAGSRLVGRDLVLSAADFTGDILTDAALQETRDLRITDTAGGLTLGDLSAAGDLSVAVQNGGGLTGGVLSAGTDLSVNASGGVDLAGLAAGRDASLAAETSGIFILARPTIGRNYFVRAADFAGAALNPAFDAFSGGDFTIEDTAGGLAVGAVGARGNLTIRVLNGGDFLLDPGSAGLTSQTGDITIVTQGGGALQLMGDVLTAKDRTVALVSSGALSQLMGRIDTGTLTGSGAANVGFASATNAIDRLGPFSAVGSLTLIDTGGLSVEGLVSAGVSATLRTTGGDLTLASGGRVTGALVQLATDQGFHNLRGADAVAASNRWLIYSAGPDANTFGGLDSGNTAVWGRGFGAAPSQAGNRYVFAVAPTVTFTSTGGTKTYGDDGTGLMGYTVSGLHGGVAGAFQGDTVASAFSGAAALSSAGTDARASVAGGPYTVTVGAGDLVSLAGYAMAFDSAGRIVVTPKAITGAVVADDKTYDGTTAGTGTITLAGLVDGDDVGTTAGTFTFADRNAGTDKVVTVSGVTLTGADAGNYTVELPATVLADIFKKALTGTVVADDKTYDGTTAGTGTITLAGLVQGDTVGAAGTFTFADKNAGTDKVVTVSGVTLTGADAGNYTLTIPASVLADIARRAITVTADPAGKLRGEADPALTWTLTAGSLVDGDSLTGALARAPGEHVGRYLIEQGDLAASGNYALTFTPGWFEIQPPAADPGVPAAQAFLQAITLQPVWTTGEGDLALEYVGADAACEDGAATCQTPSR